MYIIDASSLIYGWKEYPPEMFPSVWKYLGPQIQKGNIQTTKEIFKELYKTKDCQRWLKKNELTIIEMSDTIVQYSNGIKRSLGIENDEYHSKGVGEKDILLIATAIEFNYKLVTNEGRQSNLPEELKKYKIPAVCERHNIKCINFLDVLKLNNNPF